VLYLLQDQRLTPARKRSQMLLLVRDMVAAQSSFNARVLALRDEKRSLLARLSTARQRLSVINSMLGITGEMRRFCSGNSSSSNKLQHTLHKFSSQMCGQLPAVRK
jgi:tRNA U34 5-carboxymethylaminomethyl modifying enzyme MnmG/GidA